MRLTEATLLRMTANRAGRRPGFLAYDLVGYREVAGEDPADWLGVDAEQLDRLALCRTPRRGVHFAHDILAISTHVGVDPLALVGLIRRVEVLAEFQEAADRLEEEPAPGQVPAMLTAARDDIEEYTALSDTPGPSAGLPGWIHDAVNQLWAAAPVSMQFPRDLDFAVLVGLPLALVELPRLSLNVISEWLVDHKVDLNLADQSDRRLRACLVALGGVGLIFVDAEDDLMQRRVSLAHEAAHFIVEYLLPRQEVARRRPELLEIVDGRRPPTTKERLSAVLGDVPIGIHTHLLDRGDGHRGDRRVDEAEWRARRVALEVLAPQSVVLERMFQAGRANPEEVRQLLVEEFGLPVSLAEDYAEQLVIIASPPRPGLLDVLESTQTHPSSSREPEEGLSHVGLTAADLAAASRREPAAVSRVYTAYVPALYRFFVAAVGDRHIAEDLTGTVFASAIESLPGFRGPVEALGGWLFRIARHDLSDYQRRQARSRIDRLDDVLDEAGTQDIRDRISEADPEDD